MRHAHEMPSNAAGPAAHHVAAFSDPGEARAAAKRELHDLAGRPNPDPLHIEIIQSGHVVAASLSPGAAVPAPAAA